MFISLIRLLPLLLASRPSILAFAPLPANRFLNKLAPEIPNNVLQIQHLLFFFASFLIVLLTSFINEAKSSIDLTILLIPAISSFEIIIVVFALYQDIFMHLLLMLLLLIQTLQKCF